MVLKKQLFCIQWPTLPTNASFVGNFGHVGQIYIYIYISNITVPWAHLGFRNKNAFKISNAPNGLFHLSGLGSLMIFSYYGFRVLHAMVPNIWLHVHGKSSSTLCQKTWVFSGFLPQSNSTRSTRKSGHTFSTQVTTSAGSCEQSLVSRARLLWWK